MPSMLSLASVLRLRALALAAFALATPLPSGAEAITGVCPDGSIFIVKNAKYIPCKAAKLVEPDEVPPIRPEYLPQPYAWKVYNESQNPNNPYNLIDAARAVRELREETGVVQVELGALAGVYSAPDRDRRFHAVTVLVHATVIGPAGPPSNPVEIASVGLFSDEELPSELAHGMTEMLAHVRAGVVPWE